MHQACKATEAGNKPRTLNAIPIQGLRNVERDLQGWPRPSTTKGNRQRTGDARAGRALGRVKGEPLTEINRAALTC
ncbi:hypothetical protein V6N13_048521 [Hibiscus sabdariffa]|uniref:Uncharacterized protein n=1 Tax=Hibiscus sabdariffa TaxID=183260 RepID=A0ABR2F7G9_9ROSI